MADSDPAGSGDEVVVTPMAGTVVAVDVTAGEAVKAGQALIVVESMKMEHVVAAPAAGTVRRVDVAVGQTLTADRPVVLLGPAKPAAPAAPAGSTDAAEPEPPSERGSGRPDLAEVHARHAATLDAARPEAVDRRHAGGRRTARENLDDLCDPGSFVEYGGLALAAQRRRRSLDDLVARTPADGLVGGTATVNAGLVGADRARCVAMSYDYTVLAGTQGHHNHRKTDRLLELAERDRLPVVFFTEGGGGRPGDTDTAATTGLTVTTFHQMGRLSGLVPLVGVASGRCFAGNAAFLGCCDVVIATPEASIGMGGPAMIEGAGLGSVDPDAVGPLAVQVPNGVVDVVADDDAAAVAAARHYLSFFQGEVATWKAAGQEALRDAVPANRRRAYDIRTVIGTLADTGAVLELRSGFGRAMVTALVRVEGRPLGLLANDPRHLGGAIDADAADKAARFLQLCDAHGLPVVSLCDTPGFMVGPEAERSGTVRHVSRLFVTGANLTVPICAVILRKAYGLGAMAMFGGHTRVPRVTVAWPTGELGPMGLEGAVRLGFRRELEAAADPAEREKLFDGMVAEAYERGKALNAATIFEVDDVIDPAATRALIASTFAGWPARPERPRSRRSFVDPW